MDYPPDDFSFPYKDPTMITTDVQVTVALSVLADAQQALEMAKTRMFDVLKHSAGFSQRHSIHTVDLPKIERALIRLRRAQIVS